RFPADVPTRVGLAELEETITAWVPAAPVCNRASAISCRLRTLMEVPARILWTHCVTCCWVGSVWRIDWNTAVTCWPAGVLARLWAAIAAWAEPPADSSARSSRRDADSPIDGVN